MTGPPPDSHRTRALFRRGVDGLQRLLDRLWTRDRTYYLGEWHFHPAGTPSPSGIDEREMRAIAHDRNYSCPEPVLVVMGVGGQAQVWLFPENGRPVHLVRITLLGIPELPGHRPLDRPNGKQKWAA